MYEELQLALTDIVSPEQLDVLLDAQQILAALGLTDFEDELQQVFGLQDGISDNDLLVSRTRDVLIYALGDALTQYGVTVEDETPMPVMVGILQAVANIEHYVIPEVLHDMTLGNWQAEEIIADMTPMFSTVPGDEAFEYILAVKSDTITRIREITGQALHYTPPEDTRPPDHRKKISKINAMLNRTQQQHPIKVTELAKSGVASGQSFDTLLELSIEYLDTLSTDQVALELLGLVYYSDTPMAEVPTMMNEVIKDYTDDYRECVKIQSVVDAWGELT